MAFEGMDVDAANGQASQLQSQGVQGLQDLINTVGNLVNQIEGNWKGPDATAFQQEWTGTLVTQLNSVHTALDTFHTTFVSNINAQTQASSGN
jgi:hypothetical protein